MNRVEGYIMMNKSLIILISGLSGSNRSTLAKEIERDFKIKLLTLEDYCKNEDNEKIFDLGNGIKVVDREHIDSYDWDKFNNDIGKFKEKGVVVYGDYFPDFKLNFKADFHIHLKISKKRLIEKRKEYIENNAEKCGDLLQIINEGKFDLLINKLTYPYYLEYRDKSIIHKFINSDENTTDTIYEQVFEYIMFMMLKFINEEKEKC
jgi:uridine kinase